MVSKHRERDGMFEMKNSVICCFERGVCIAKERNDYGLRMRATKCHLLVVVLWVVVILFCFNVDVHHTHVHVQIKV